MPINQPSNQIKFTNVSVVRLKKGMFTLLSKPIFPVYHLLAVYTFFAPNIILFLSNNTPLIPHQARNASSWPATKTSS